MIFTFDQPVDKMDIESPIVFNGIKSHECLVGERGILGVMSDFDWIDIKFCLMH